MQNNIFNFKNFIGQEKIKKQLNLFILPKLIKNKNCDHILLEGIAGTGKTTLASIIANETKQDFKKVIAPVIKNKSDLISLFCNIEEGTIIFFDEVHRLEASIEEMLYQIMDENKLNIIVGKEGDTRFLTVDIPKFTIIAATTLSGMLSTPFKDRFGFRLYMSEYNQKDIQQIIKQNLEVNLSNELLKFLSVHSKNIPRIAINITKRINDYGIFLDRELNKTDLVEVLNLIGFKFGLNHNDIKYLKLLQKSGPLSLESISKKLSIEKINIKSDIEPYLLKQSLIELSSRGRSISAKAIEMLKEIF